MNNYYNSIFVIFIFSACLAVQTLTATDEEKRKRDKQESSSAANKRQQTDDESWIQITADEYENDARERINQQIEFRERALVSINKLKDYQLECTVGSLSMFDAELNVEESNVKAIDFLKACDLQALNWITDKTKRLDELGQFISRWLSALNNFHKDNANNLELMLTKGFDARKTKNLANRLIEAWVTRRKKKKFSSEVIENGKRAYYLGEGFCVHLLTAPFDRVELFMKEALKKFPSYVRNMNDPLVDLPTSVKIYIAQKSCREFYANPKKIKLSQSESFDPLNVNSVWSHQIRDTIAYFLRVEKYECGLLDVFKRKQQYSLLSRLSGASDFKDIKKTVDKSLDAFVDVCLLKMQESDNGASQISKSAKGSPWEQSLPVAVEKLRDIIESYQLSDEESINDILDVRSTSNNFKDALIAYITAMIFDEPNFMLVQFFIDLLYGRLRFLKKRIFTPSIYKNKQSIEYKSLEFLLQIFSIKGYKPKPTEIKIPLLDFYYLYKISEICNVISIETATITNADLKEATLELVGLFNNYEPDCMPDAFESRYQDGSEDEAIEYFQTCDEQARIWLEAKISRLSNYGLVIARYLNSIGNFLIEDNSNLYTLIKERKEKKSTTLVERLRNMWRYSRSEGYKGVSLEYGTHDAADRTLIYGDGVCVHLQEHPFDKVGKFVDTVLKYFEPSHFAASDSLKIYAFQKMCRQSFETYTNRGLNPILSPTIDHIGSLVDEKDKSRLLTTIMEHTRRINANEEYRGRQCNEFGVFSLKHQYYALYLLEQDEDFLELKASIDKSTDEFVSSCLSKMATGEKDIDLIYVRVKNTPYEKLLPIVVTQLSLTISFFQIPLNQSVNDILDIRSPGNKIRSSLMEIFEEIINNTQDLKLVRLFTGLLLGRLSDFERGIFIEPIYANQDALEFKLIEFLFNVFSIKGYMPGKDVNSRLLDYYYLYKINEINSLVPIDESIDFDLFVEVE